MTFTPRTWCLAEAVLAEHPGWDPVALECDLEEDHAGSEFPSHLHYDRARDLLWAEREDL